jgi:hypothetical protein
LPPVCLDYVPAIEKIVLLGLMRPFQTNGRDCWLAKGDVMGQLHLSTLSSASPLDPLTYLTASLKSLSSFSIHNRSIFMTFRGPQALTYTFEKIGFQAPYPPIAASSLPLGAGAHAPSCSPVELAVVHRFQAIMPLVQKG